MPSILRDSAVQPHLNNLDVPTRQAKVPTLARNRRGVSADAAKVHTVAHKKVAIEAEREESARLLDRARVLSGLTADRFAREVGMHPTQLSKQTGNAEPPQLLRVLFSPMRRHLTQAIVEKTEGFELVTQVRRIA